METTKLWIRDSCRIERLQHAVESAGLERLLTVKAVPYLLLALAAVTLLVQFVRDKQRRQPRTWLKSRPRSPDPEKPTDINTFAERRMKATDRPPGSMSSTRNHNQLYQVCRTDSLPYQHGRPYHSNVQPRLLTQTGPSPPPHPCPIDPSATGPTTSPWASAACNGTNGSNSTITTSASTRTRNGGSRSAAANAAKPTPPTRVSGTER